MGIGLFGGTGGGLPGPAADGGTPPATPPMRLVTWTEFQARTSLVASGGPAWSQPPDETQVTALFTGTFTGSVITETVSIPLSWPLFDNDAKFLVALNRGTIANEANLLYGLGMTICDATSTDAPFGMMSVQNFPGTYTRARTQQINATTGARGSDAVSQELGLAARGLLVSGRAGSASVTQRISSSAWDAFPTDGSPLLADAHCIRNRVVYTTSTQVVTNPVLLLFIDIAAGSTGQPWAYSMPISIFATDPAAYPAVTPTF